MRGYGVGADVCMAVSGTGRYPALAMCLSPRLTRGYLELPGKEWGFCLASEDNLELLLECSQPAWACRS